jgi:hypothetical protein
MRQLADNKEIKLRKISKIDYHKYTATPFFEFLRKIGKYDENGKKVMIAKLMNYEKIKEGIEHWENV